MYLINTKILDLTSKISVFCTNLLYLLDVLLKYLYKPSTPSQHFHPNGKSKKASTPKIFF